MKTISLALCFVASAVVATGMDVEAARQEEARSCNTCHSLRIVHSQRLPAAAWGKELDKMAGWGASIPDRQLLLEYLAEEYSDKKPMAEPETSGDGSKQHQ